MTEDKPQIYGSSQGSVKIEGLREFVAHLKEVDEALPLKLREVFAESAELVARAATRIAPVGTYDERDKHPGALAMSIRYGATPRSGWVNIGSPSKPYAGPIVYGWHAHNITAQPFPYQALDASAAAVWAIADKGIGDLIEEVYAHG